MSAELINWLAPRAESAPWHEPLDVHDAILDGLPGTVIDQVAGRYRLSRRELACALGIARRTLDGHRQREHLPIPAADRLCRVAGVLAEAPVAWLHTPHRALGSRRPLDVLHTSFGSAYVLALLDSERAGA